MTQASNLHHPLSLLIAIEDQCRAQIEPVNQLFKIQGDWSGLGFRLEQQMLLLPIHLVQETYSFVRHGKPSPVPGAKAWLKGLVSLRGQLLSVIDFNLFLHQQACSISKKSRVIVIRRQNFCFGLLVDEVLGIRHFKQADQLSANTFSPIISDCLEAAYSLENNQQWGIIDIDKLLADPEFQDAANG
ncbi:MAG: chemotaxis protein CheW [Gammaproteobacteria bacterium]|nr:chemotaxis protein CheW [Gammaproteobacteria bacterium]